MFWVTKIMGGDDLIPKLVNENMFFLITVGQIKSYSSRIDTGE